MSYVAIAKESPCVGLSMDNSVAPPTKSWAGSQDTFVRTVEIDRQNHQTLMRAACLFNELNAFFAPTIRIASVSSSSYIDSIAWTAAYSTRLSCAHLHRASHYLNIFSKDKQNCFLDDPPNTLTNANRPHPWVFVQGNQVAIIHLSRGTDFSNE